MYIYFITRCPLGVDPLSLGIEEERLSAIRFSQEKS
jgi:hypothetical protein